MTKKIKIALLMLAAVFAATLLTGCSGNDFVEEIELEEMPIDFSSSTQSTTRAASVSNNAELAAAGGFYVWGWKTPTQATLDWSTASNPFRVFNKQQVTSTTGNGAYQDGAATNWTYSPKKYWDRKSTYCFYAAGPVNADGNAGTISLVSLADQGVNQQLIKITGVSSQTSASSPNNDFVIDRTPVGQGVKQQTATDNVNFTFHHVMSKVVVKVIPANNLVGTVKVTNIQMKGWNNAKKDFTQNLNWVSTTIGMSEWSGTASYTEGTATFLSGGNQEITSATPYKTSLIFIPQAIPASTLKFLVSYTITYSDETTDTFTNVEGVLSEAQNWYTDCCTTYTLTISPDPIQFDVNSVTWSGEENHSINITR